MEIEMELCYRVTNRKTVISSGPGMYVSIDVLLDS
jgi:hypothetical protein